MLRRDDRADKEGDVGHEVRRGGPKDESTVDEGQTVDAGWICGRSHAHPAEVSGI